MESLTEGNEVIVAKVPLPFPCLWLNTFFTIWIYFQLDFENQVKNMKSESKFWKLSLNFKIKMTVLKIPRLSIVCLAL